MVWPKRARGTSPKTSTFYIIFSSYLFEIIYIKIEPLKLIYIDKKNFINYIIYYKQLKHKKMIKNTN